MISPDQRKLYWANLNAVLKARSDLSREEFHAQHYLPASTKDFTKAHMDTFLAACAAVVQPSNLKPQLRAFDQPKARLLHKILVEQAAQLKALGKADPAITIGQISVQKFRGRHYDQLSANKRPNPVNPDEPKPSELEMLMFTVARQISELRQARGWSQHELLWQSGLGKTCECAECRHARHPKPKIKIPRELVADNVPF